MKVLYVTSEALPFAATGGLGDVAGSLPHALRKRLVGARIVMPLYEQIPEELRENMKFLTSISVPVSWRRQYCGIFEARCNNVIYYLLDNQYYFKRQGLYGHYDDAERFAFFSRAAIEILPFVEFKPDVIISNDWQSGLVPIYYSQFYANAEGFSGIKTVFTIHNISYQGCYGMEILGDVFGLPLSAQSLMEHNGDINIMKGAIESANAVTTVSPTYANELLDPWYAHGLDTILRERSWKMRGILNGIDYDLYNPETDTNVFKNYTEKTFKSGKKKNKNMLRERLELPQRDDVPVIGMITRLVEHKGLELIMQVLDQILTSDIQFVILGSGDWKYESALKTFIDRYPDKFRIVTGFIPELSRKIYAGADMLLMPSKSEPCGLAQMIALRYGTIPIVRETGGLKDTVIDAGGENGNGFTFKTFDAYDMLDALNRALGGFSDKKSWNELVLHAMQCDNSWSKSANELIRLLKNL